VTKWATALLCTALLLAATSGRAEARRVAVLAPDPELLRALHLALSPWSVTIVPSETPAESSPPDALRVASRMAHQLRAEAVVWVSPSEHGSLLWVFDARAGEVTTRMLVEAPPFDGAVAAAVALSVKTVLRASFVAPPTERFGAQASPPPAMLALEGGAGVFSIARGKVEPRVELAPVLWFSSALGLSLELSSGPALAVEGLGFRGHYQAHVAGAEARFRFLTVPAVSFAFSLGGSAHVATLRGSFGSEELTVRRLNGSLDVETFAAFRLASGVYLGASLGAQYLPARRHYLVRGTPIFSPSPFRASLQGYVGVDLF
jgi:hypothetical protein